MRTDLSSEIDASLAGRNAGANGFWEVARSGNGDMKTDLMVEDGKNYEEFDGTGETVEEVSAQESQILDQSMLPGLGSLASKFKAFRSPRAGEQPPHAPKPGKAWVKRRIPMNKKRPGGNHLCRCRWAQVSQSKWNELKANGKVQPQTMDGLGAALSIDITSLLIGGGVAAGVLFLLRRRSA